MWRWAGLLLVLGVGCRFGEPTPQQLYARSLQPQIIGPVSSSTVAARPLLVRVWADRGHVRGVMGWQSRFREQAASANRVLSAVLGVAVQIVAIQTWDYEGSSGDLGTELDALKARDPGEGVDIVVGLVSPLAIFSPVMENLGMAEYLGKHMVMRGIEDPQEHLHIDQSLDEFSDEERHRLYLDRIRHREQALFLHELGHLFGAWHVWRQEGLMHSGCSAAQEGFVAENLEAMRLALAGRTMDSPVDSGTRERIRDLFEHADPRVVDQRGGVFAPPIRPPAPTRPAPTHAAPTRAARHARSSDPGHLAPRAADSQDNLRRVQAHLNKGELEAGWKLLEPEVNGAPQDPVRVGLACELLVRKDPSAPQALSHCQSLATLRPESAGHHLLLAMALQGAGQAEAALDAAQEAQRRLEASPSATPQHLWSAMAQTYQRLDAVTWAQQAAAHGDPEIAGQIAVYVRQLAKAYWLDASLVPPEREPEYIRRARDLQAAVRARQKARIDALAQDLAVAFPKVAGPQVAVCQLFGERKQWPQAKKACRRTQRLHPGRSEPYIVLGVVAFAQGRPQDAVTDLEKAVALRPKAKDAWSLLLLAYRAGGKSEKAGELAARYQAKFGERLR